MKVYLDMDGVLADMEQGYLNALDKVFDSDWGSLPEDFFLHLPPMKDADFLVESVFNLSREYDFEVAVLTAIPRRRHFHRAAEDKATWIFRNYPQITEFLIGPYAIDKQDHCRGKTDILIDDSPLNYAQWRAKGGTAIYHESAAKSLDELVQALEKFKLDPRAET
jgi:5'(3')-deoxyribonucleotidase